MGEARVSSVRKGEARVRKAARGHVPRHLASTQSEVIILVKQQLERVLG